MHLTDVCTLLDLNVKTMVFDEEMSATDDVVVLFDDVTGEYDEQQ